MKAISDKQIIAMYRGGMSLNQIAKKLGRSNRRPQRVVKKAGIMRPPCHHQPQHHVITPADQRVVDMYAAGHSLKEIADRLGRSVSYSIVHLKKAGVKTRPSHGHKFHKQWKGGRASDGQGYWRQQVEDDDPMVSMRDHHRYVKEHRLVVARKLGRPLLSTETVHHINGDRGDNRPENLELRQGQHGRHVAMYCMDCGSRNIGHAKLEH